MKGWTIFGITCLCLCIRMYMYYNFSCFFFFFHFIYLSLLYKDLFFISRILLVLNTVYMYIKNFGRNVLYQYIKWFIYIVLLFMMGSHCLESCYEHYDWQSVSDHETFLLYLALILGDAGRYVLMELVKLWYGKVKVDIFPVITQRSMVLFPFKIDPDHYE